MAEIRLEKLRKDFGSLVAVRDITMTFPSASVTCLLGPSGCGKTTLMRMIAGLEEPTSGEIYFGDDRVTDMTPSQRNIGMVFQYPVVYRGVSVFRNIELPLTQDRSISERERKERIHNVLETLDLAHVANHDVSQLDNGTRQKVAVARAVARRPRIILFDEPITNVDVNSKVQLKRALKRLVKQHSQTIIYVTHDQTEAMTLADEIALMRDGEIVQRDIPRNLYNKPNDRFGGWFLGNPGMNFVYHSLKGQDGQRTLVDPLFKKPVKVSGINGASKVMVGIRPERIQIYGEPQEKAVEAELLRSSMVAGGQHLMTVKVGDVLLKAKVSHSQNFSEGSKVYMECPLDHVTVFDEDGHRLEATLAY